MPDVCLRKSTPLVSSYEVTPVSEMKRTVTWQGWLSSALYKNFHGFYFPSARCQDAAAFGGDEEGVGWSCELHLWPERRLQQTFPGAESCHVSPKTIVCVMCFSPDHGLQCESMTGFRNNISFMRLCYLNIKQCKLSFFIMSVLCYILAADNQMLWFWWRIVIVKHRNKTTDISFISN